MTNNKHKFPYKWNLADGYPAKGIAKNECNVFGTFICGGGSTMGYKLAGFNHLGGVEIDVKVADVYKENHKPKYLFVEDIRAFNKRTDLPTELYNLDILDGSPPCSTFSMAGSREKAWGKSKQFREGQAMQTLDDLVFVYCDTIIKLQPKVFLLENVKGIIQGNAKAYSKAIVKKMQEAGYTVQVFCLNAASMGVPQKRERVFFIGHKKEFGLPKLNWSLMKKQ
jgi:DNA (cytosine-5)-methyltransferase 1